MNDEPIAFFITWTVYGTFLPGDNRGWVKRGSGTQLARPLLANWHSERLKHSIELLAENNRICVEKAIQQICNDRSWKLWIANPRSNHVHVVITAPGRDGATVRDQLKARCTRELRLMDNRFCDRTVWTRGGDWKCINTEEDLEVCIQYAGEAQDRKDLD